MHVAACPLERGRLLEEILGAGNSGSALESHWIRKFPLSSVERKERESRGKEKEKAEELYRR